MFYRHSIEESISLLDQQDIDYTVMEDDIDGNFHYLVEFENIEGLFYSSDIVRKGDDIGHSQLLDYILKIVSKVSQLTDL